MSFIDFLNEGVAKKTEKFKLNADQKSEIKYAITDEIYLSNDNKHTVVAGREAEVGKSQKILALIKVNVSKEEREEDEEFYKDLKSVYAISVFDEVTDDSAKLAKIKPMFYGDGLNESDALRDEKTAVQFFNSASFDVAKKQLVVKKKKEEDE